MTTAEKRAALDAAGEQWPDCECHGERMSWSAPAGRFRCQVRHRAQIAAVRARRLAEGVCGKCGGPLDTETLCRACADRHADMMAKPQHRLAHQLADSRFRQRERAQEGFQSTGAGLAAFAAWTEGKDH